jgi:hypothetical protein
MLTLHLSLSGSMASYLHVILMVSSRHTLNAFLMGYLPSSKGVVAMNPPIHVDKLFVRLLAFNNAHMEFIAMGKEDVIAHLELGD